MIRNKLLASVAVTAMLAMPAFAQTSSPSAPASRTMGSETKPSLPSDLKMAKVSDLVGKNVYTATDEKIGDINEIVVPKSGGQVMAVIGVGGFLGIGEKEAAVPFDDLKVQGDKIVASGATKDSLKQHADYKAQKDSFTKLDKDQVVGQASGATGTSGSSSSGSSSTGSSTGSSGSSSMGSGSSSGSSGSSMGTGTGSSSGASGSMGSGSSTTSPSGSSSSGSSTGSPNPAATTNPPDNSTATKKQ